MVWHDGPDLAGRAEDLAATKNAETLALAARVPDPDVRGRHLVWRVPTIVVRLRAGRTPLPTVVASVESLLAAADAHVWVDEPVGSELVEVLEDPRVHAGAPSAAVLARSRYEVVCEPVLLSGGTLHDLEPCTPVERPGFRMVRIRDANRNRRGVPWPTGDPWPSRIEVERAGTRRAARAALAGAAPGGGPEELGGHPARAGRRSGDVHASSRAAVTDNGLKSSARRRAA